MRSCIVQNGEKGVMGSSKRNRESFECLDQEEKVEEEVNCHLLSA